MTARLRPHHMLCMLTYAGKGYSPAFTANMTVVVGRIAGGEPIEIVSGPDDICAPLLSDPDPHCHRESVAERDRLAAEALGPIMGVGAPAAGSGFSLDCGQLGQLRQAFRHGGFRVACAGCQWQELCSDIARDDFEDAIL